MLEEIIVTSQAQLDALPIDTDGRIIIKFGTPYNRAVLNLYIILNLCTDRIEFPYSAASSKTWFFSYGIGIPNDLVKYVDRQFNMRGL